MYDEALATLDRPLKYPETAYERLWNETKSTPMEPNQKVAFNFLEKAVMPIIRNHNFSALRKRVNSRTSSMLADIRLKMKKDRDLFRATQFREDEVLTISNHRLER